MSDTILVLAGGAIGAVLTAIGVIALRLAATPGDVAANTRRADALDEDLERWVADDHRALRIELQRVVQDYSSRNLLYSGALLNAMSAAKTAMLQRYRDRESTAVRSFADLRASESTAHRWWRDIQQGRALLPLAPERLRPVIDDWRAPAAYRPAVDDEAGVYDPTGFSTDDLFDEVKSKPLGGPVEQPHGAAARQSVES